MEVLIASIIKWIASELEPYSYNVTLSSERRTSMANGDPLRIGIEQPPDNRATSATSLIHNGSAFGDQRMAFWVQRLGAPVCEAAIRGDNFFSGPAGAVTPAAVMGVVQAASAGVGVLGATTG